MIQFDWMDNELQAYFSLCMSLDLTFYTGFGLHSCNTSTLLIEPFPLASRIIFCLQISCSKLSEVAEACNPPFWEAEAGEPCVQDQLGLHSEIMSQNKQGLRM